MMDHSDLGLGIFLIGLIQFLMFFSMAILWSKQSQNIKAIQHTLQPKSQPELVNPVDENRSSLDQDTLDNIFEESRQAGINKE